MICHPPLILDIRQIFKKAMQISSPMLYQPHTPLHPLYAHSILYDFKKKHTHTHIISVEYPISNQLHLGRYHSGLPGCGSDGG